MFLNGIICMKLRRTEYIVNSFLLHDDGVFPNNSSLPVIHYKKVFSIPSFFAARAIKKHFAAHGWTNSWKGTIHHVNHYYSTTHLVLGAYRGRAELMLGGDKGIRIWFEEGDVLTIPAGVAHKKLDPTAHMSCIGAYPEGRSVDLMVGARNERPAADRSIELIPLPRKDPVFGADGELMFHWKGYKLTA